MHASRLIFFIRTFSISLITLFVFGPASVFAANKDRHVVVISIDGFPADMWSQPDLPVPNLRRLASEGSSAERMTGSNPSSTWSSHTTIITGLLPRSHGVLYNGQIVLQGPGKPPLTEQWADKDGFVLVPRHSAMEDL